MSRIIREKLIWAEYFTIQPILKKAQRHLEKLRVRLNDMRETLENTALCALAEKMEDEDMKFDPQSVWFTDEGASTHGWINPATGGKYSYKAEMTVYAKLVGNIKDFII